MSGCNQVKLWKKSNYNEEEKWIKMFILKSETDRSIEIDFKDLSDCILMHTLWHPGI